MTERVRNRQASAWASVALAGLLLVACGESDDGASSTTTATSVGTTTTVAGSAASDATTTTVNGSTPTESTTATVPPTAAPRGPKVGEVVDIVPTGGRADDELVAPGTALRKGALLAAEPAGTVDFKLDQKLQRCQVRPAGKVRVVAEDVLLEFVEGTVWCGTTAGGGVASFRVAGDVLRADDPVFSVTASADGQVEVRVVQGFVQVQGGPTLGEGQRGNRSGVGESWTIGPFGLGELPSSDENDEGPVVDRLLAEVMGGLPPISYPRPDVERSPTLRQAVDSGAMRVLVVDTGDEGPGAFAFELFGTLIADRWGVPVEVEVVAEEDAVAQLEAGEAAIVVAPGIDASDVPLFEDAQGQVWRALADPQDGELRSALEGTLRTALQATCDADGTGLTQRSAPESSCYDQIYGRTIGGVPVPVSAFAGILGL